MRRKAKRAPAASLPPSGAESFPQEPRTVVGRWLLANLLHQQELQQKLSPMLNGGKAGWNNDEPAVVEVACQLTVGQYFRRDVDIREITAFAAEMRSKIYSVKPPGQLETEALIRLALGDPDVVIDNIVPLDIFTIQGTVTGQAVNKLGLTETDIRELVMKSERLAFERGWNPPLAE